VTDLVAQVRRHLLDIPDLVAEASYYFTPGSAPLDPTFNGSGGKGAVYRIPISPEIFDLLDSRDKALDDLMLNRTAIDWEDGDGRKVVGERLRRLGVLPSLGLWVSLAYAELQDLGRNPRDCCPARSHTIAGETAWLTEYAAEIVELHDDFARDIELLWTELRRACRIRKEYVPSCPQCSTDRHRNYLEGVYGSDEDAAPAWWRCRACGFNAVRDAEIKRVAALQPRMTLRQIASLLRLPLRTLHNWRTQGRFSSDSRGLYELEHVKRAAQSVGREVGATA
jgi:transposase-like protein